VSDFILPEFGCKAALNQELASVSIFPRAAEFPSVVQQRACVHSIRASRAQKCGL
jgi:hypothetical protein